MILAPEQLTAFRVVFSLVSLAAGVVSSLVIWKLKKDHEKAMATFQLQKDRSITDFKIFFYSNLLMVFSFLGYWYGSLAKIEILVFQGRYSLALYTVVFTLLLVRWWRRF
ncbi:MAG: hypothetical protein ABEK01_05255 [Candidatus Nanohaloarchaea archaeon]